MKTVNKWLQVSCVVLLFVIAYLWGAGSGQVEAGVKPRPVGLPHCTEMAWEVAGQTHIFEIWYTDRMFVVRDHGAVVPKRAVKDVEDGLLLPPPKDVDSRIGM